LGQNQWFSPQTNPSTPQILTPIKLKTLCIALCFASLSPENTTAQIFSDGEKLNLGLAIKLNLGLGGRRSSFYNLSVAAGLSKNFQNERLNLLPGAQVVVNYYSKGPGTSLIDHSNRFGQLDVVSSFYVVGGYNWDRAGREKYIRTFNQMSATTIRHNFDGAVSYGTSFLVNNQGRNQQLGHMGFNIDQILVGYYNDGFWPFDRFASDGFDRYWSGGGYLAYGLDAFGNRLSRKNPWFEGQFVEYAYDRFTGNVQAGYKLSKELLFSGIPQQDMQQAFYNRALSSISLRNINGSNIGFGLLGQCPNCDVQDLIHRAMGYSRHVSLSKCVPVALGSFQFNQFYPLLNKNPQ
jgi:hypothetical protein